MDDVNLMFTDARKILDGINEICDWEIKRREEVFKEFVNGICKSESLDAKKNTFDNVNNWLIAVEAVCPKTAALCDELRKMLGVGAGIK